MNKKKLAFVISSLSPGGAERVVSNLANNFVDNYDVSIITIFNDKPFYKLDHRIQIFNCLDEYENEKSKVKSAFIQLKSVSNIYSLLKKNQIDLVIGFMTTANIYSIFASRVAGISCIVSERIHPEYSNLSNFWSRVRKLIYPYANKIIVQTTAIKKYYLTFLEEAQLEIVKNPLSDSLIKKRKLNTIKKPILLTVGRLSHQKNHKMLIEAFNEINLENWELHIVGEGRNRSEYEALISNYNLNDRVKLIGNVTNIEDYYNTSSIFAFTSNFEGFPNALTEAMAFGLPCISTDCPSGPSELIKDGVNGFLIPVGDKNQLKEKLTLLVNNLKLRETIGEKAMKSTAAFEAKNVTLVWNELIKNTLKN